MSFQFWNANSLKQNGGLLRHYFYLGRWTFSDFLGQGKWEDRRVALGYSCSLCLKTVFYILLFNLETRNNRPNTYHLLSIYSIM